jgi:hypothetical protein
MHEWLKHIGGHYIIKLLSQHQSAFVGFFNVVHLISAGNMGHIKDPHMLTATCAGEC